MILKGRDELQVCRSACPKKVFAFQPIKLSHYMQLHYKKLTLPDGQASNGLLLWNGVGLCGNDPSQSHNFFDSLRQELELGLNFDPTLLRHSRQNRLRARVVSGNGLDQIRPAAATIRLKNLGRSLKNPSQLKQHLTKKKNKKDQQWDKLYYKEYEKKSK